MSPVGDITIYESQLFRAYGAPKAADIIYFSQHRTCLPLLYHAAYISATNLNFLIFMN